MFKHDQHQLTHDKKNSCVVVLVAVLAVVVVIVVVVGFCFLVVVCCLLFVAVAVAIAVAAWASVVLVRFAIDLQCLRVCPGTITQKLEHIF